MLAHAFGDKLVCLVATSLRPPLILHDRFRSGRWTDGYLAAVTGHVSRYDRYAVRQAVSKLCAHPPSATRFAAPPWAA
jgi:hypothetical protein